MDRPKPSLRKFLVRMRAHIVIGFCLVFLIGYAIAYAVNISDLSRLEAHGVEAEVTVQRRFTVTQNRGEGRRDTSYRVEYSFTPPDGEQRLDRADVSRGFYNSVSVGDRVTLRYLPDDPATAELDMDYLRGGMSIIGIIGLGFAAAVTGYGWFLWRRASAMWRAVRHGEKRSARVLGWIDSQAVQSKQRLMQLHWIDDAGKEGRSAHCVEDMLAPWPEGSEITVYADPQTGRTFWEDEIKA